MIGVKCLHCYKDKTIESPTGLTICESKYKDIEHTRGIVEGPHHVFTKIEKCFYGSVQQQKLFLLQQYNLFNI